MTFHKIEMLRALRQGYKKEAAYNLAVSSVPSVTPADLGVADIANLSLFDADEALQFFPAMRATLARRCEVPVENIALTPASTGANYLVPAALLSPGDEALVEHPTYEPMWRCIEAVGGVVKFFDRRPEENFRLDPAEVEKRITPKTRLVVLSSLHNPSMQLAADADIAAVAEIAARRGARVFIDCIYYELFADRVTRSPAKLADNVIVNTSFGKALGLQGIRVGWLIAPPDVVDAVHNVIDHTIAHLPTISIFLLQKALEREAALRERARKFIDGKVAIAEEWARGCGLRLFTPPAGATVFVRLPHGVDSAELATNLLRDHSLHLDPGEWFGLPGFVRISMIQDADTVRRGLDIVAESLK